MRNGYEVVRRGMEFLLFDVCVRSVMKFLVEGPINAKRPHLCGPALLLRRIVWLALQPRTIVYQRGNELSRKMGSGSV